MVPHPAPNRSEGRAGGARRFPAPREPRKVARARPDKVLAAQFRDGNAATCGLAKSPYSDLECR
jgi:hypothetical protein